MKAELRIKDVLYIFIAILLFACNDEYDWTKVEPGKQKIMLLTDDSTKLVIDTFIGNETQVKSYKAISRGGSVYSWESSNAYLSITARTNMPYIVDIKAKSQVDTFAWLKVTETTWGGKKGLPDSAKIIIIGYCNFNKDQLIGNGNFRSKMTAYAPYNTILAFTSGDSVITNYNFFNMRWAVQYKITDKREQKIEIIPGQRFVYNDEWVEVKGKGTYNTCKSLIVVNFAVCYLYGDTLAYGSGIDSLTIRK